MRSTKERRLKGGVGGRKGDGDEAEEATATHDMGQHLTDPSSWDEPTPPGDPTFLGLVQGGEFPPGARNPGPLSGVEPSGIRTCRPDPAGSAAHRTDPRTHHVRPAPRPMSAASRESQPHVQAWELPAYYRALKSAILSFEEAWTEGTLPAALADPELQRVVGPGIAAIYGQLQRSRARGPTPFRRNSIHAILEPVKELLSDPERSFSAVDSTARTQPPPPPAADADFGVALPTSPLREIEVAGLLGPVRLSMDQVAAARAWGVGFEFEDPTTADAVAQWFVDFTLQRVAVDLRDLEDIERWLRRRRATRPAPGDDLIHIVPDAAGRRFEQLMLDLLNEERLVARRAPLREDFIEKTDLRVHMPGLNRRRGARVQVTQTTFQDRHEQKLARIPRVNEFVILSPRTLADALDRESGTELLAPGDLELFWAMFPQPPIDVEEMARGLRQLFTAAVGRPTDDPRGPLTRVPPPLRQLVRAFVTSEAYRTTSELRERERRDGPRYRRKRRLT
jgi:hypothetical protein